MWKHLKGDNSMESEQTLAYIEYHRDRTIVREKDQWDAITCPACKQAVAVVRYGNGWVGVCCGRLAYSGLTRPQGHR